jgi:hypothetical protein
VGDKIKILPSFSRKTVHSMATGRGGGGGVPPLHHARTPSNVSSNNKNNNNTTSETKTTATVPARGGIARCKRKEENERFSLKTSKPK